MANEKITADTLKTSDLPVIMLYDMDSSWASHEIAEAIGETCRLVAALRRLGHSVTTLPLCDQDLTGLLSKYSPQDYIVFNWCEGFPGVPRSEADVVRAIESMQFVYTGSTADVLMLSRDKRRTKEFLERCKVPTPRWKIFDIDDTSEWTIFPAIVKPAFEHCSMGVTPQSVVLNRAEFLERLAYIFKEFNQAALVEEFIDGREFHVALWGNGVIEMLPPVEMDFSAFSDIHDRLCTYEAKFVPSSISYQGIRSLVPAPLSASEMTQLEQVVRASYQAIGCRDYARIDIRLKDGIFYTLDVNPNADISKDASMGCAAKAAGYSYGAMGSQLVRLAAHRHPVFSEAAL